MPHAATATRMSHIFGITCWPPRILEEGDIITTFFVKDLGLVLAPKTCPDQSHALKEVNNSRVFTARRKNDTFFLNEPLPGAPRQVLTKFSAIIRRTDCVGTIKPSYLKPKIESTLKPTNSDAKQPWFLQFIAQKSKYMSTPFLRDTPWNFAHVFHVPLLSPFRMCFFSFVAGNVGSLKTQISPKMQKSKYMAEKRTNVKGSAGAH